MNIKDIAKIAGVGVGTVSRVINNHPDVKEETRKKIKEIIEEYNYVPNNSARNLKQSNSNSIGILVRGVFNPFFSEMIDIISKYITNNGYTMTLRHTDFSQKEQDEIKELISFSKERKLKGIIYLGCDLREVSEDTFKDINIPLLLSSPNRSYEQCSNFSSISIKQSDAAFNATKYLIDNGNKRIAIILGPKEDSGLGYERLLGYMKALVENNIEINEDYILYGGYSSKGAYDITCKLLKEHPEIEGIFCISDIMATGAARSAYDIGRKVGEDLSIVGFDGMELAKFYNPSLTTILQPRKEMAEITIKTLIDLIRFNKENKHIVLQTKLIEGESCKKR